MRLMRERPVCAVDGNIYSMQMINAGCVLCSYSSLSGTNQYYFKLMVDVQKRPKHDV